MASKIDFQEVSVKALIPNNLKLDGELVNINPPKFHVGQNLVWKCGGDPTEWLYLVAIAPILEYALWDESKEVLMQSLGESGGWSYLWGERLGKPEWDSSPIPESQLVTVEEYQAILQAMAEDPETLKDLQYLAYLVGYYGCQTSLDKIREMQVYLEHEGYEVTMMAAVDVAKKYYDICSKPIGFVLETA